MKYTVDIINNPTSYPNLIHGYLSKLRKTEILTEVFDYFNDADMIDIEGFTRFRLDKYKKGINRIIDDAISEYLNDNEVCRNFEITDDIEIASEMKYDTVNVILKNRGYHKILDKNNVIINSTELRQYVSEVNGRIDYNALLLTELLNIYPKRIILHDIEKFQDADLISSLREVLGSRLEIHNQERKQQL